MRFLKKKIQKAMAAALSKKKKAHQNRILVVDNAREVQPLGNNIHESNQRTRTQGMSKIPESSLSTKNIVKNYAKAICNFSTSPLALPYLASSIEKGEIKLEGFISFMKETKPKVEGLYHFRSLLLPSRDDNPEIISYKKIIQRMGEVFINYFSVNWIFHSKILYKEAHLKFRFKMLRRIRAPEFFTYLNNVKDKKKVQKLSR